MPDTVREPLIAALLRVPYQIVISHVVQELRPEFPDLRPAHLIVFQLLDHPPGGTRLTDLAERAQMTPQSMGELIDSLESRGYVARLPDPADRRAKLIQYTDRGWTLHERGAESVAAIQTLWAQYLGADRFDQLIELLRELYDRLQSDQRT
ncbi:MAG: MarR family winged helix-turn-helix transcriptional regulator [Dehalococcoidia bacterium]